MRRTLPMHFCHYKNHLLVLLAVVFYSQSTPECRFVQKTLLKKTLVYMPLYPLDKRLQRLKSVLMTLLIKFALYQPHVFPLNMRLQQFLFPRFLFKFLDITFKQIGIALPYFQSALFLAKVPYVLTKLVDLKLHAILLQLYVLKFLYVVHPPVPIKFALQFSTTKYVPQLRPRPATPRTRPSRAST